MDHGWAIVLALATCGGLAGYVLGTLLFRPKGTLADHEERIELVEGIARSVQRAQKAERMRELRGAAQGAGKNPAQGGDLDSGLPLPQAMNDPRAAKAALRQRVFSKGNLQ